MLVESSNVIILPFIVGLYFPFIIVFSFHLTFDGSLNSNFAFSSQSAFAFSLTSILPIVWSAVFPTFTIFSTLIVLIPSANAIPLNIVAVTAITDIPAKNFFIFFQSFH